MKINVISPGLLTTIQDLGRIGYQRFGVSVGGAMDTYAMRISNILVGNEENEGVLEITISGPTLSLEKGTLFAITGGDMSPTIDGERVPKGRPIYLKNDAILKFGSCISGSLSYIAVAGGFNVPKIMGSKSTYLRGGFGGLKGRALKKNDVIEIGNMNSKSIKIINKINNIKLKDYFIYPNWYIRNFIMQNSDGTVIRVFEDRQYNKISEEGIEKFFNTNFNIDVKSDRMGYRLWGEKIKLKEKVEIISEEVSLGTIQIPPDGNPIILLADRQTVGGYPKIAHVASVDIQKLVQLKTNNTIKFKKITLREAEQLYFQRERDIIKLKKVIEI